ncbi:hypothetical protein EK21DRAFT_94108 [Setomelanomma holmii]|uniref:Uncharacterized protein n=1 Tax=Setomelanomma holmii TaxID=210430 RepID=A0A9P4LHR7_9PLEO|nr:hypothetical protein EK21DRAFT_94108 [Setomelanomma holmii]
MGNGPMGGREDLMLTGQIWYLVMPGAMYQNLPRFIWVCDPSRSYSNLRAITDEAELHRKVRLPRIMPCLGDMSFGSAGNYFFEANAMTHGDLRSEADPAMVGIIPTFRSVPTQYSVNESIVSSPSRCYISREEPVVLEFFNGAHAILQQSRRLSSKPRAVAFCVGRKRFATATVLQNPDQGIRLALGSAGMATRLSIVRGRNTGASLAFVAFIQSRIEAES